MICDYCKGPISQAEEENGDYFIGQGRVLHLRCGDEERGEQMLTEEEQELYDAEKKGAYE